MRIERESTDLGLPHDDARGVSALVQFGSVVAARGAFGRLEEGAASRRC
jgi:hypothetical protein